MSQIPFLPVLLAEPEGIGAALVYRVDGSTGGVDILGFIAKKFYNIGISTTNFIFNAIVVTCALYFVGLEPVLYSLVLFFLCFKATNVAMVGFDYKKSVLIITQQPDTIRKLVISEVNRGITILKGAGGYTGKDKEILLVVVKIRQLGHLLKLIERVDPAAFVLVQDANDVFGRGFTNPMSTCRQQKVKRKARIKKVSQRKKRLSIGKRAYGKPFFPLGRF